MSQMCDCHADGKGVPSFDTVGMGGQNFAEASPLTQKPGEDRSEIDAAMGKGCTSCPCYSVPCTLGKARWKLRNAKLVEPRRSDVREQLCRKQGQAGASATRRRLCNAKLVKAPASILVTVHKLSGDRAQMKVGLDIQASELKRRVAEIWQIPPECQKLCVGPGILEDTDKICDLPVDESSGVGRCIMVMLSTMDLQTNLASDSKETQLRALRSYAALGWKSADHDIQAVANVLAHWDPYVRIAAVDALVAMTSTEKQQPEGNEFAIRTVAQGLEHPDPSARCAAVSALVQISPRGHQHAVDSLMVRLHDLSSRVRCCVVQALPQVMTEDDSALFDIIIGRLQHPTSQCRCDALVLASKMAGSHGHRFSEAVAGCFDDSCPRVRAAAVQAMLVMVSSGSEGCIERVVDCIGHKSEHVHASAELFVHRVAQRGDERVVNALRKRLASAASEDTDAIVTALESTIDWLVCLERPGNLSLLCLWHWADELLAGLKSSQARLRCASARGLGFVLQKLAKKYGGSVIETTCHEADNFVEQRYVGTGMETTIIKSLLGLLKDPDSRTLLYALCALIENGVCQRWHVEDLMDHPCPKVREVAEDFLDDLEWLHEEEEPIDDAVFGITVPIFC